MTDYGDPRSYLAADAGIDVVSADGERVGTLTHVLADVEEDIFDGIVIDPSTGDGHRFVDAPEVDEFYERAVTLRIPASAIATLQAPSANPAVLENHGVEDSESHLQHKLRRAWDLISGRTY
jgi:sporulation protein YlmC with PRC-barrel domain